MGFLQKMLQQAVYGTQGVLDRALLDEAGSKTGTAATIDALLTKGAALEGTDNIGQTPLLLALQHGTAEVQQKLLDAGANIHARSFYGMDALMYAAQRDLAATMRILAKNPDIHAARPGGETALMLAVDARQPEIAAALFKAGADADKTDLRGASAKTRALQQNQPKLLRLFMPDADMRLAFMNASGVAATTGADVQTARTVRLLRPPRFGSKPAS